MRKIAFWRSMSTEVKYYRLLCSLSPGMPSFSCIFSLRGLFFLMFPLLCSLMTPLFLSLSLCFCLCFSFSLSATQFLSFSPSMIISFSVFLYPTLYLCFCFCLSVFFSISLSFSLSHLQVPSHIVPPDECTL
jgi:hypothetical protein